MDLIRALILGIVQGLTEFLPVSSSGHLILVRALFDWPDDGLAFDVGLHLGTTVALLAYFWRDWLTMLLGGLEDLSQRGLRLNDHRPESQLLWLIALGSVPAGVTGLLFDDWIEENVRQAWLVAVLLIVFGVVLWLAERGGSQRRNALSVGPLDALIVGVAQAVALLPGVSRSGVTISAALFRGLRRDEAARFAFLLGTPAFVGAAFLKAADLRGESGRELVDLGVGFVTSMVVGFLAISWLLEHLRRRSLEPFVTYRIVVGLLTLIVVAAAAL